MTIIRDPQTGVGQNVTKDGYAKVLAIIEAGFEHASEENSLAFSWASTYSATAADEIISVQNDDNDRHLHISHIEIGGASTALFTLFEVTSGTPGGTPVTAQNLNLDSAMVAEETAFGNAAVTGSLSGNTLAVKHVPANDSILINTKSGLILAKNDIIAITVGSNSVVAVTIYGFYSDLPD